MLSLPRRTATGLTFVSILVASACAAASAGEQPVIPNGRTETTVYIIRHAEKMTEQERDPELSPRGRPRAESLAEQLRHTRVNVIITSNLKRTIQTATPLARLRHIYPKIVSIEGSVEGHVSRVADEVLKHQGGTILVVGHNNTVGKIVEKIGGGHIGDLCADEYSNLIIVVLEKGKPGRILLENYGESDPPSPSGCPHLKDRY
jgi:phosphohistidine phosphatase SixA